MDIKVPPSNEEVEELHYSSLVRDPNPRKFSTERPVDFSRADEIRAEADRVEKYFKTSEAKGLRRAAHFIETGEWE